MDRPSVVTREQWLAARKRLLAEEKELTRRRDELNEQRRQLPVVRLDKAYEFEGADGRASLIDIFEGRRQLIVYHLMWRSDLDTGCPSCSFLVDSVGDLAHLHAADTTFAVVSRGPWPDLDKFRARMGWQIPFYSSFGSDFNYDYHVTLDESVAPIEYNFQPKAEMDPTWVPDGEQPGISVFLRDGDEVYHTYSAYARGLDLLLNTYNYLDLTPLGRQLYVTDFRHHDRYGTELDEGDCY